MNNVLKAAKLSSINKLNIIVILWKWKLKCWNKIWETSWCRRDWTIIYDKAIIWEISVYVFVERIMDSVGGVEFK